MHRDVKPANLLLHATGTARPHLLLTDFGISARLDDPRLTHASQVIGSPGYMAPEQLAGADPAPTQDVYAVGMVGLEMLSGVRPPHSREAVHELVASEPSLEPLASLLLEAARPESTERPATAAALRERLLALDLSATPQPAEPVVVLDQLEAVAAPRTRVRRRDTDPAGPADTPGPAGPPAARPEQGPRPGGRGLAVALLSWPQPACSAPPGCSCPEPRRPLVAQLRRPRRRPAASATHPSATTHSPPAATRVPVGIGSSSAAVPAAGPDSSVDSSVGSAVGSSGSGPR